jgi:tRNA G18 (ribose-2'-O)-methylase SpoU
VSGRGYYAIGIEHSKNVFNIGTLWRSANLFGAAFIFTVGRRYTRQASDTMKTWRHIPLFNFDTVDDLIKHVPYDCRLVGVELDSLARPIGNYVHPERAIYLLGAEDNGLTRATMNRCHALIQLPGRESLNVASAGTIVLYDRHMKTEQAA